MENIADLAALILMGLTLWDLFVTVFSTNGSGFFTRLWSGALWRAALFIHRRWPIHRALSYVGPFILFATIILWYVLLGLGLFVALAPHPGAVVNSSTGAEADLLQVLYFVTTTISSLGYGDLVPSGYPWTLLSTTATLAGTIVLTVSLSYVISVVSTSIERRALAQGVFAVGKSVPEWIRTAQLAHPGDSLKTYVMQLSSQIDSQSLKYLAFPIAKYFHTPSPMLSPSRALLLLSDSLFVLSLAPDESRPPPGVLSVVESSINGYVGLGRAGQGIPARDDDASEKLREAVRELWGEAAAGSHANFDSALAEYLPRRDGLLALCEEEGWPSL